MRTTNGVPVRSGSTALGDPIRAESPAARMIPLSTGHRIRGGVRSPPDAWMQKVGACGPGVLVSPRVT